MSSDKPLHTTGLSVLSEKENDGKQGASMDKGVW